MTDYTAAMNAALQCATNSPDPSTQNGAVLVGPDGDVLVGGCNEFAYGTEYTKERWERPAKYSYIEHAERNVIYEAARTGIRTQGLTIVAGWAACADCARAIVQAGLDRLVRIPSNEQTTHARWGESIDIGDVIMLEGGIEILNLEPEEIKGLTIPELRRDGHTWDPFAPVAETA